MVYYEDFKHGKVLEKSEIIETKLEDNEEKMCLCIAEK
jgi:hypothetical protein